MKHSFKFERDTYEKQAVEPPAEGFRTVKSGTEEVEVELDIDIEKLAKVMSFKFCGFGRKRSKATLADKAIKASIKGTRKLS